MIKKSPKTFDSIIRLLAKLQEVLTRL